MCSRHCKKKGPDPMIAIKSCTHGSKGPGSYGPPNRQPLFLCHSPKKDVHFVNMILTYSSDFFQGHPSPNFEFNPPFQNYSDLVEQIISK